MLHEAPNIPNYTIVSPLGAGTSGHVWLAKDVYGERRAIKVAHFDYLNDTEYKRRFIREVKAQQQLFHVSSHVARIFSFDENHIPPYIVMDYINGSDLNRLVATDKIKSYSLLTRLHWIEALSSTLTKAHSIRIPGSTHGIIHRDIKPQNIRIQGERPYLLDFSISLTSDVEIDSTQDAMTLRYAAPELRASAASDIFSFGLVTFEILYEKHALTDYNEATGVPLTKYLNYIIEKLEKDTWNLPSTTISRFPSVNDSENQQFLDFVFKKVFSLDPSERYETPKQFTDDVLGILLGKPNSPTFQMFTSKITTEIPYIDFDQNDFADGPKQRKDTVETPDDDDEIPSTIRFTKAELDAPHESEPPVQVTRPVVIEDDVADDKLDSSHPKKITRPMKIDGTDFRRKQPDDDDVSSIKPPSSNRNLTNVAFIVVLILAGFFTLVFAFGNNEAIAPDDSLTLTADSNNSLLAISNTVPAVSVAISPTTTHTATARSTASPTATATSTTTATTTFTATASTTNTPTSTITATASSTRRATHTATPDETDTVEPSLTHTRTPAPTATASPTDTPTITATASPTRRTRNTSIPNATSAPMLTASPLPPTTTPTLTPSPEAWEIAQETLTFGEITTTISVVYVPAGCIITRSNEELCVDEGMWVDLDPVSNANYDLCSRTGDCSRPAFGNRFDPAGAGANNFVVGVNFAMAQAYCINRQAELPNADQLLMLVSTLPSAFTDVDEWVFPMNIRAGQGQIITRNNNRFNRVWVESSYIGDNLSFRCLRPIS